MLRIPFADATIAVLLSIAVAVIFAVVHPVITNDSFTFAVGKVTPATVALLPRSTFPASVADYQGQRRIQHRVVLNSPADGSFTVTGVTFNGAIPNQAMKLQINGRIVTHSMLETGITDANQPVPLRSIAQNVRLRNGENELIIRTPETHLPIVLRFERQAPLAWWRPAAVGALSLVALWLLAALSHRFFAGGFRQPIAAVTGTLLFTGASIAWIAAERGREFIIAGNTAPNLANYLDELDGNLDGTGNVIKVCTLGDSTHRYVKFDFDEAMRQALNRDAPGQYHVYGLSHGGMTGRDFYLLLNKVLAHGPDIVVMPINVATFDERWYNNTMWHFHALDRFLRLDEFPRAFGMEVGRRRFQWERVFLHRADAAWFDQCVGWFVSGLQLHIAHESTRLGAMVNDEIGRFLPAAPPVARPAPPPRTLALDPDSDMIAVFQAITALAEKHNAHVIYYAAPLHSKAQQRDDIDYRMGPNLEIIRRALSGSPNVTFLNLDRSFPEELFRDEFAHLKPEGIQYLADRVAQTIESLNGDTPPTP